MFVFGHGVHICDDRHQPVTDNKYYAYQRGEHSSAGEKNVRMLYKFCDQFWLETRIQTAEHNETNALVLCLWLLWTVLDNDFYIVERYLPLPPLNKSKLCMSME